MQIGKKKFVVYLIVAFVIGAAVSGGAITVISKSSDKDDFSRLNELYKDVEANYYMDIDKEKMLDGACKGFIAGLGDPYSSYMTKEEYESFEASATGEYSGIGITFTEDFDGNYVVVEVAKGSPAEDKGIKAGDILVSVDGKVYDDMELMSCDIRGKEGSDVKLVYIRNGKENEVVIKRAKIIQRSVESEMLNDKTGYISISSFIESTYDDFKAALESIERRDASNLILDLRNNGGGLVDSCIKVADEFLDEGTVVYVEDKEGNRKGFDAKDGKTDLNVVVLVNENSASAAEILAAALKDNGVKIVGQKTFGKGIIQSTSQFKDGSALKLTVMKYLSPKGNEIHKKGIEPDYSVKNQENSDQDKQLEKAESLF